MLKRLHNKALRLTWHRRVKPLCAGLGSAAVLALAAPAAYGNGPYAFIGQLNAFAIGYGCPQGWLAANGQLLQIRAYSTLFGILGSTYGGDGINTFALPNLAGRAPVGAGQGTGLQQIDLGQVGGAPSALLNQNQLPAHSHMATAQTQPATRATPGMNTGLAAGQNLALYGPTGAGDAIALPAAVGATGLNAPIQLGSPRLAVHWCIAVEGDYPPRP